MDMKKCSYCGVENEDAALTCKECGTNFAEVAAENEPPTPESGEPLVVLATFDTMTAAAPLMERLEEAGIEACIPEELAAQMEWQTDRVTLRVKQNDYAAAKDLMNAAGDASPPPET
jgi:hypothetical protein